MSLRDKLSGLVGNRDDDIPDAGDPKGEVEWKSDATGYNPAPITIADAEASIDYQHPDALPAVDAAEDAGLSAVRKLKGELG